MYYEFYLFSKLYEKHNGAFDENVTYDEQYLIIEKEYIAFNLYDKDGDLFDMGLYEAIEAFLTAKTI